MTFLTFSVILSGCRSTSSDREAGPPPLGDTLVAIFQGMKEVAFANRVADITGFLETAEAARLSRISRNYGSATLGWCLERQLGSWPDPDTLDFEDLIYQPPYARIALSGPGRFASYREDRVCFTFFLFKREQDTWRLAAVSSLEKERFDPYGTELSYLETELPSKLRFPRLF